jgi:GT2 family glycosyltransferase
MKESESIVVLIVLYKKTLKESNSYRTFVSESKNTNFKHKLIVYNNSSEYKIEDTEDTIIINSEKDGKLPQAYNYALNFAVKNNAKWLLILDQDTEVTKEYLIELENQLNSIQDENLVAIVPKLVDNNTVLSPKIISNFGWWENKIKESGYQTGRIVAFNSLSFLNVKFIQELGGFSEKYPLDMLDHWYYNQIYLQNKNVFVLDSLINHSLSFQNYEQDVSIIRHIDFLEAENKFVKELGLSHFATYKLKLFLRSIKQFIFFKNKEYSKFTFRKIISK